MATGQMAEAHFYSTLGKDPVLTELVQMFVDEMPQRVQTLRGFGAASDWEGVGRAAHQLKGAAGSYGFHELTPYAAQLEAAIHREHAYDQAPALLEALVEACGRVRAGSGQD
jgi:HPt (histidine-containing phosphotransfer) domain-containing protein